MRRAAEQTAARWSREADELTAQCPDFDLGAALKDDRFCALLRAGIDVRTAWFALHAQALLRRHDAAAADGAGAAGDGLSARRTQRRAARERAHPRPRSAPGRKRAGQRRRGHRGAAGRVAHEPRRPCGACRARGARRAREAEPVTRFAYICRDGRCVLRADGHAAYCPGSDIVCAGASALMCALAGALDTLGAQGVQRTLSAGHAAIAADDRTDVRAAFTVAVTGLRQLAVAYPGHVAEGTGRTPAQEEPNGSAAAGCCPGAVPGSGQQRKKET